MVWREIFWWGLIIFCTAPIWGTLIWFLNELYIRPMLIPNAEIQHLADELKRSHPANPVEAAFAEEQNAWYRSETFEQGKWRRVRRHIIKEEEKTHGG
jgi:hypothetical protein